MLKSKKMARKIGSIIGKFEEMNLKEVHKNGQFLQIKVTMDLKDPLKRGTMVKFKDRNTRVPFKYERLPTFCFISGRMGHQLKDCEMMEDLNEEGFEELKDKDLSFGQWFRASPLPKLGEKVKKKESSYNICSKDTFNVSSSQSRCESNGKGKTEDQKVQ